MHLGLARTALLAWLRARSLGGQFVLRMEDIDQPRVVAGSAESMLADLRWLGIDWDEGPDVGGVFGPYVQSQRVDRYRQALDSLEARGLTYPCTCSRKEVSTASAPHGPSEFGPPYPGTCRRGPTKPGLPAALRLRVPEPLASFVDAFSGEVTAPLARGDFVLRRADGLYSYQLAVVLDDIAMGITEVVRGEDLSGCTGWQLALYEALEATPPAFAHVPLMMGPDGKRLAKRHASVTVASYRQKGTPAERIVGFLAASAGLVPSGVEVAAHELVRDFSLERVARGATQVSLEALAAL